MSPQEIAAAKLAERGIRSFSLVGGSRVERMIAEAIEQDRRDYPRVIKRQTLRFTDEDWALEFDEDSGEEAWWITLQLLDPELRDDCLAELSLSDVEAERLIGHLQDMITTGRRRFR